MSEAARIDELIERSSLGEPEVKRLRARASASGVAEILRLASSLHTAGKENNQMTKRFVVKHPKGWAVKGPNAKRASSVHRTQADAEGRAKEVVSNLGGGEVTVQGRDGKFRDSDTVAPGNDPMPPKDKKH